MIMTSFLCVINIERHGISVNSTQVLAQPPIVFSCSTSKWFAKEI